MEQASSVSGPARIDNSPTAAAVYPAPDFPLRCSRRRCGIGFLFKLSPSIEGRRGVGGSRPAQRLSSVRTISEAAPLGLRSPPPSLRPQSAVPTPSFRFQSAIPTSSVRRPYSVRRPPPSVSAAPVHCTQFAFPLQFVRFSFSPPHLCTVLSPPSIPFSPPSLRPQSGVTSPFSLPSFRFQFTSRRQTAHPA